MTSTIERLRYAVKTFGHLENQWPLENKLLVSIADLKRMSDLIDAVEELIGNWPQHRDAMDLETLPVGVKATRHIMAKLKEDE